MDLQILQQDSQVLAVKAKPEPILLVFISIWSLGFGGLPLMYLPFLTGSLLYEMGTKTLTCQRPTQLTTATKTTQVTKTTKTISCQTKADKFFGMVEPVIEQLPPITTAKFNRFKSPKSNPVYWMTLIDQKGKAIAPFANEWEYRGLTSDAVTIQSWVDQVNQLIKSPQLAFQSPVLTLTYPVSKQWSSLWIVFFLSLFPITAASVLYLILRSHTLTCDRISQTITWQCSTLFGRSTKIVDWTAIQRLEIHQRRTSKGQTYYELTWLTETGVELPRLNHNSYDALIIHAEAIANFLNLSIDDHTISTR